MRVSFLMALLATLGSCGSSTENTQATGGSSGGGSGGTSSGGATSGGAAGAAGSGGAAAGSGGTSSGGTSSGGTSSGGTSSGGTSSGGTGGSTTTDQCQPLCNAITAAACSQGPTMAGCLLTCKTLTSAPKCDPTANTYFACVKQKGVQCTAGGEPFAPGCGIDYLKAIDCATTENPNPSMVTPCADYCKKVVAASCASNGTEAECNSNCKWFGAKGTGCDDEWGTFLTCANGAKFSCLLGYAVAQGCGTQFTAYSKCIDAAGK